MTSTEFNELAGADPVELAPRRRTRWLRVKLSESPGKPLSHDKLAARIGRLRPNGKPPSRSTVIGWEKGRAPRGYARELAHLGGIPEELWLEEDVTAEERIAALEESMSRLEDAVADVYELNERAFRALADKLGVKIPPKPRQQSQARQRTTPTTLEP